MKIRKSELTNWLLFSLCLLFFCSLLQFLLIDYTKTIRFYFLIIVGVYTLSSIAQENWDFGHEEQGKTLLFVALFILFFVLAFREGHAMDDESYRVYFYAARVYGPIEAAQRARAEIGYFILMWIIGLFTHDYFYVQIVTALIPLLLIGRTLIKLEKHISIQVMLFLFSTCFYFEMISANLARMFIALGIVAYSIPYLLERERKKYVVTILIAILFHYSAIIMLMFSFLAKKKRDTRAYRQIALILFLMFPAIGFAAFIMIGRIIPRYAVYASYSLQIGYLFSWVTRLPAILVFAYFKRFVSDREMKERISVMQYIATYSIAVKMCAVYSAGTIARLVYYFDFCAMFGFGMLYHAISSKWNRMLLLLALCVYGVLFVYRTKFAIPSHAAMLFPYRNMFFAI